MEKYRIPEGNMAWLRHKIGLLNKRAAKIGKPPITINVVEEELEEEYDDETDQTLSIKKFLLVTVDGVVPKLDGWIFAGTLRHVPEIGNILRPIPWMEDEIPLVYRDCAPHCDYCGLKRRRNDTYLVRKENEPETWRQVGSTCLQDFIDDTDIHNVAKACELLCRVVDILNAAGEEGWDGGGSGPEYFYLDDFLAYSCAAIEKWGWTSRGKVHSGEAKVATADDALRSMFPPKTISISMLEKTTASPEDKHRNLATDAREWVQSLEGDLSEYEHNIHVVSEMEAITHRESGLAASIIRAYQTHLERESEAAREADSKHFGTVGKREVFELTVIISRWLAGAYGSYCLTKFVDDDGNIAVWFGSKELEVGRRYKIRATVKKHDGYNSNAQTILSRPFVLED